MTNHTRHGQSIGVHNIRGQDLFQPLPDLHPPGLAALPPSSPHGINPEIVSSLGTDTFTGKGGTDDFNTGTNWSSGMPPSAGEIADIPKGFTEVAIDTGETPDIGGLILAAGDSLIIGDGAQLAIGSGAGRATATNAGTIVFGSANSSATFTIDAPKVQLTGGGTLDLLVQNNQSDNVISAASSGDALDNINNLIEGAGLIGGNGLVVINGAKGVIDANASQSLTLVAGSTVMNSGLLETDINTGNNLNGLVIVGTVNGSGGGTIAAVAGNVLLEGGTVAGGTISTTGTNVLAITVSGSGTFDGTASAITNTGDVQVEGDNTLNLYGTLKNDGTLSLNQNQYGSAYLSIGPASGAIGTATISGSGTVLLTESTGNYIQAGQSGNTLVNASLISGSGTIGNGTNLAISNTGTIDAMGTISLVLNSTGILTNNGLLESTDVPSSGTPVGLVIDQTVAQGKNGMIAAVSGNVLLEGGSISGGTLTSAGSDQVQVTVGGGFTLNGSAATITNDGQLAVEGENTLTLLGSLVNQGTFSLDVNSNGAAVLAVGPATGTAGTATLSGTGELLLNAAQGSGNYVLASESGDTLVNNQLITGSGTIGDGSTLTITNNGTIDATGSLSLVLNSAGTLTNNGLLEATAVPAGLNVTGLVIDQVIHNSSTGLISALGGDVLLEGGSISGGTISSSGTNQVQVTVGGGFTLDGSTSAITNTGQLAVEGDNTLSLLGSLVNTGTVSLDQNQFGNAVLSVGPASGTAGTVTLSGGGVLLLNIAGGNGNFIVAGEAGDTLINDQLITGSGTIGNNTDLALTNHGTIDATGSLSLVLNSAGILTNDGLLEATAVPAGLSVTGLVIDQVIQDGASGVISAVGGDVLLERGSIAGGTISSTGTNQVQVTVGGAFTLNGTTNAVTNIGQLAVEGDNTLTVLGSIVNNGTLSLNENQFGTAVISIGPATGAPGTVTLSGTGTLLLNDSTGNYIIGGQMGATLINQEMITGAGTIGDGTLTLVNAGTIEATGANGLVISLGSGTGLNETNARLIAAGAGGLSIQNGTITNQGTIEAQDGSGVVFGAAAALTNSAGGTLTGGTYEAVAASHGATLSVSGGTVSTLNANVVLSGANAVMEFGGVTLGTSLNTIAGKGALTLGSKSALTLTAKSLTDNGTLALAGGALKEKSVKIGATGALDGFGKLTGSITDSGTVLASGGTLDITKNLSGAGTLQIANAAVAEIGGSLTAASTVFAASGTETLQLAKASLATTVISGFARGDIIDLTKTAATSLKYSGNSTSGTLMVLDNSKTVADLQFSGDYTQQSFSLQSSGNTAMITGTNSAPLPDFGPAAQMTPAPEGVPQENAAMLRDWTISHFDTWLSFAHVMMR